MKQKTFPHIIAVDFDGTLVENAYPEIGAINLRLVNYLKKEQKKGTVIILWTCRNGKELENALSYCRLYELNFDFVNENADFMVEYFGGSNPRKIFANEYIDDRNSWNFDLPYKKDKNVKSIVPVNNKTEISEYVKEKRKVFKELHIHLSLEDIDYMLKCNSYIQVDNYAHDLIMAREYPERKKRKGR